MSPSPCPPARFPFSAPSGAHPAARLRSKYDDFKARMTARAAKQAADAQLGIGRDAGRRPRAASSENGGGARQELAALPARVTAHRAAVAAMPAPLPQARAVGKNGGDGGLEIYCDDNLEAAAAAPQPTGPSPWTALPTVADARKENTAAASSWAGVRLPQHGAAVAARGAGTGGAPAAASSSSLDVYVDESFAPEAVTRAEGGPQETTARPLPSLRSCMDAAGAARGELLSDPLANVRAGANSAHAPAATEAAAASASASCRAAAVASERKGYDESLLAFADGTESCFEEQRAMRWLAVHRPPQQQQQLSAPAEPLSAPPPQQEAQAAPPQEPAAQPIIHASPPQQEAAVAIPSPPAAEAMSASAVPPESPAEAATPSRTPAACPSTEPLSVVAAATSSSVSSPLSPLQAVLQAEEEWIEAAAAATQRGEKEEPEVPLGASPGGINAGDSEEVPLPRGASSSSSGVAAAEMTVATRDAFADIMSMFGSAAPPSSVAAASRPRGPRTGPASLGAEPTMTTAAAMNDVLALLAAAGGGGAPDAVPALVATPSQGAPASPSCFSLAVYEDEGAEEGSQAAAPPPSAAFSLNVFEDAGDENKVEACAPPAPMGGFSLGIYDEGAAEGGGEGEDTGAAADPCLASSVGPSPGVFVYEDAPEGEEEEEAASSPHISIRDALLLREEEEEGAAAASAPTEGAAASVTAGDVTPLHVEARDEATPLDALLEGEELEEEESFGDENALPAGHATSAAMPSPPRSLSSPGAEAAVLQPPDDARLAALRLSPTYEYQGGEEEDGDDEGGEGLGEGGDPLSALAAPPPPELTAPDDFEVYEEGVGEDTEGEQGGATAEEEEVPEVQAPATEAAAAATVTVTAPPSSPSPAAVHPFESAYVEAELAAAMPQLADQPGVSHHAAAAAATTAALAALRGAGRATRSASLPLLLAGRAFMIEGIAGTGAVATVYEACPVDLGGGGEEEVDVDDTSGAGGAGDSVALKVAFPPSVWEWEAARRLAARLGPALSPSVFLPPAALHVLGSAASVMVSPFGERGTLQDVINAYLPRGGPPPELLAMFYTAELLRVVEAMHARGGMLHGDVKPDNMLLMDDDDGGTGASDGPLPEWSSERPGGWSRKGLRFIDLGRAVDLEALPPGTPLVGDARTSAFRCREMLEGAPWRYQGDAYGVAVTAHCLLFGDYMKEPVWSEAGGPDARPGYVPRTAIKRYWAKPLWEAFFWHMLNFPAWDAAPPLAQLRAAFEAHLAANGRALRTAVLQCDIVLGDRRSRR